MKKIFWKKPQDDFRPIQPKTLAECVLSTSDHGAQEEVLVTFLRVNFSGKNDLPIYFVATMNYYVGW